MKRANLFLSILPVVCFALTPLGCMNTDSLGLAGNADASAASGGLTRTGGETALPVGGNELVQTGGAETGGAAMAGAPELVGGNELVGGAIAAGGAGGFGVSVRDDGTCALLFPSSPVYYPSDVGSPCPAAESSLVDAAQNVYCAPSLIGVRCAYPSPISGDAQDIFTCTDATGTNDPNGLLVTFGAYWDGPFARVCRRSGNDCDIDNDLVPSSLRIDLTLSCDYRSAQNCSIGADVTAQEVLDRMMGDVVASCLNSAVLAGTTTPSQHAALSVWFDGDCPTSFVVYPAEFADCVQAQLETQSFPCASGLSCSTSGTVGGCPCRFRYRAFVFG
jgi:hypothetical protein